MNIIVEVVERNLFEYEDTYIETSIYNLKNTENGREFKFDYCGYVLKNDIVVLDYLLKCKIGYIDNGMLYDDFLSMTGYSDTDLSRNRFNTLRNHGEVLSKVS